MSSVDVTRAKREAALEHLKFSKRSKMNASNSSLASSASTIPSSTLSASSLPPQSRDATVSSRFFPPSTPPTTSTILVPDSSPTASPVIHNLHQSSSAGQSGDVAPTVAVVQGGHWNYSSHTGGVDPLAASSGFVSSGRTGKGVQRRPWDSDDSHGEEPPRKRLSASPTDVATSPDSPAIQRAGQRRRNLGHTDAQSTASDESLPEVANISADTAKPRIFRGRLSDSAPSANDPLASDQKFVRFKLTMPMESPDRVKAAWLQATGDVRRATTLLSDPDWVAKPTPTPSPTKTASPTIGRVDGYVESTKAQRVAAKEKGKKSMIYANRLEIDSHGASTSTPPPSKHVLSTPAAEPSPVIRPAGRKRAKKMVLDTDSEEASESDDGHQHKRRRQEDTEETRTLAFFNSKGAEALQALTGCTPEQANTIIGLRPFDSVDDLNSKLGQGKKKSGPAGISPRLFDDCTGIFKGYGAVDRILEECEDIGSELRLVIAGWTSGVDADKGKGKAPSDIPESVENQDGSLNLRSFAPLKGQHAKSYLVSQPSLLSPHVQLKDYQLLGVNWLRLLYDRKLSCILADEMGLGKTIQVISFFAHLKEHGRNGPHLIVVPSSTLENWVREFTRFAPSIRVQTYYGSKDERVHLRQNLLDTRPHKNADDGWNVLITTYNLAQGDGDRKFFRRIDWDSCVFDEGHVLKNFQSQRYQALLKVDSKWRLLLTGTPLQNNLQELVSLMNFILPEHFSDTITELRAIFKVKGDSKVTLLAQERVSRAKKMMTPFVLRRRKDQVLTDLPKKTERFEWCDMTTIQKTLYRDALKRSRKTIYDADTPTATDDAAANGRKPAKKPRAKDKLYLENSTNVLMDLRKAASHPMLFRKLFTDDILRRGALFDIVKEDMSVMTDAELQLHCGTYKSTKKFLQDDGCYLNSGKVQTLLKLLDSYNKDGRKVLIFSQFTQILDILQVVLKQKDLRFLVLTGSTPVDVRQSLVDEFTEDEGIPVFLLSTKAGGMGINLTAASVVIMFDQDFNPHNDRQAQDRAYRIGQKCDVDVVKLISRGTIEEDMLRLGETKLALDEAVAGEADDKEEAAAEREIKTSLMSVLRQQFERQEGFEELAA
ncbi:SNF2 family N-terminal domain-containing protein [Armillaria luteobubalina]|uniref:DNA helicase n=1 Tax=Armillaria luteobubalina TaxID=153913 RepID=A0AA39PIU9_9AGAR|nr:SNF2 family N-terminal domain-containing protein [Armillaria luteobubalina]